MTCRIKMIEVYKIDGNGKYGNLWERWGNLNLIVTYSWQNNKFLSGTRLGAVSLP